MDDRSKALALFEEFLEAHVDLEASLIEAGVLQPLQEN